MPLVLAEGEMTGAPKSGVAARPRRPLGRGGLPLLCAVLALVAGVPLAPLVRPIKARLAGHVVVVGTTTVPANAGSALPRQGLAAYTFPSSGQTEDQEHVQYIAQGPLHVNALRVKDWVYYLVWFRGHRQ